MARQREDAIRFLWSGHDEMKIAALRLPRWKNGGFTRRVRLRAFIPAHT